VDTSLTNYGRKQDHPKLLLGIGKNRLGYYNNSVHIYTDAYKTTTNKTSAAFCIPELNIQHSVRLSNNITIFAAELSAIKLALVWVIGNSDKNSIFSDSYSCL